MLERAATLSDASMALDGYRVLNPREDEEFRRFYVERPETNRVIVREAVAAARNSRAFHWFYTGHTGAGKSTELNRLMDNQELRTHYLPLLINIADEFDINNIDYTDIVFAMGKACAHAADKLDSPVPAELKDRIASWGKEIVSEQTVQTQSEAKAGLKVSLPFFALGEEIKSGGSKRKLIRERIYDDITDFIRLLDDLTGILFDAWKRMPLCVIDGLDHVDVKPCRELFNNHFVTLTKPRLSKLFVVPLSILNDREFAANTEKIHSTLPNVKVFDKPGSDDLDPGGLEFCREVISRHAKLDLFADDALESLFVLSGGILRDMIRNAGDACGYAADDAAERVEKNHAGRIWDEMTGFYRRVLERADYAVLRAVADDPFPKGLDGIPSLLHLKAIIFYPNGEGWYGVSPAVRKLLDGK